MNPELEHVCRGILHKINGFAARVQDERVVQLIHDDITAWLQSKATATERATDAAIAPLVHEIDTFVDTARQHLDDYIARHKASAQGDGTP